MATAIRIRNGTVWGRGYTREAVDVSVGLGARGPQEAGAVPVRELPARDEDTPLVQALTRGDSRALEALYERYSRSVYSLALHLLNDRGTAEEVVQETFVKFWRRPEAYQPERGRLQAWLLGVAHHHAVDILRRRQLEQRHRATANGEGPSAERDLPTNLPQRASSVDLDDPAVSAGANEQRQVVFEALATLPSAQRIPLELAYYRGLTQSEIAAALGEPLGTIKTRMRLALLRLRNAPSLVDAWEAR